MERKHQVAEQLRALMKRHGVSHMDIEQRTADAHGRNAVSNVTVRRILNAEAKTEPDPYTLRRIAEACGESYAQAFPETEAPPPGPLPGAVIEPIGDGAHYALKFTGDQIPDDLRQALKMVVDGFNSRVEGIDEQKKRQRRRPK